MSNFDTNLNDSVPVEVDERLMREKRMSEIYYNTHIVVPEVLEWNKTPSKRRGMSLFSIQLISYAFIKLFIFTPITVGLMFLFAYDVVPKYVKIIVSVVLVLSFVILLLLPSGKKDGTFEYYKHICSLANRTRRLEYLIKRLEKKKVRSYKQEMTLQKLREKVRVMREKFDNNIDMAEYAIKNFSGLYFKKCEQYDYTMSLKLKSDIPNTKVDNLLSEMDVQQVRFAEISKQVKKPKFMIADTDSLLSELKPMVESNDKILNELSDELGVDKIVYSGKDIIRATIKEQKKKEKNI